MRPYLFLFLVLAALSCGIAIVPAGPAEDLFPTLVGDQTVDLDALAVEEVAALKLLHLTQRPPYDVILFGNSRPMPVGADDLGLSREQFFNATLSGQSLRAHVLLLETLAGLGKLPRVALVSIDNAELQLYANPTWASAPIRLPQAVRDLTEGLMRPSIGAADLARMAKRHLMAEGILVAERLTFERVKAALGRMVAPTGYALGEGTGFRADGSRISDRDFVAYQPTQWVPYNRNVVAGYLEYDLERLARIQAQGTRVILFETFLHPELTRRYLSEESQMARETRTQLVAHSARLGLEFHLSPGIIDDGGRPWIDPDHPPRPVIAAHIRAILGDAR